MSIMRSLLMFGMLAGLAAQGAARELTVCMGDRDFPPVFFLDRDGQAQWLVRRAVERQGDHVKFVAVPWRRCLQGLRNGTYPAAIPVAGNPSFLPDYAFPMRNGLIDSGRELVEIKVVVVRRVGSQSNWTGTQFTGLESAVLYPAGIVAVKEALAALAVHGDDGTALEEQTLHKLIARKADVAIIYDWTARQLLDRPYFQGKLEILPLPFVSRSCFLALNRAFYDANTSFAEAVWDDLKRLRATPEWLKAAPAIGR